MQRLTTSKTIDLIIGVVLFMGPAFYGWYHVKHHMSVENDLIFFECVSIGATLALIQKTLFGILEKMSAPMTMKIVDKTIDMGEIDMFIKAKE